MTIFEAVFPSFGEVVVEILNSTSIFTCAATFLAFGGFHLTYNTDKHADQTETRSNRKNRLSSVSRRKRVSFSRLPTRSKLGWILLVMTIIMVYGVFRHYTANDDSIFEMNRTYIVVLLLWLAWPELEALPRWFLTFVIVVGLVCAWRPQYLVFTIPALFLFVMFRPSAKRKKKSVDGSTSTLVKKK